MGQDFGSHRFDWESPWESPGYNRDRSPWNKENYGTRAYLFVLYSLRRNPVFYVASSIVDPLHVAVWEMRGATVVKNGNRRLTPSIATHSPWKSAQAPRATLTHVGVLGVWPRDSTKVYNLKLRLEGSTIVFMTWSRINVTQCQDPTIPLETLSVKGN